MKSIHDFNNQEWVIISSAWGDIFCSLQAVKERGFRKIIYYGYMPAQDIEEFLNIQDFIEDILIISTHSKDEQFYDFWESAVNKSDDYLKHLKSILLKNNISIKPENIYNGCCDITGIYNPAQQIQDLKLSPKYMDWASTFVKEQKLNKFIIVNPYSVHSSKKDAHWPHWEFYLKWLFSHEDYQFVFVGYNYNLDIDLNYKNVLNLFNKLPSNLHVLALSMLSNSVITTSNNLAHWCNANNIICTTMCNSRVSFIYDYFGRILSSNTLYKVEHYDSLNYAKLITKKNNFNYFDNSELPIRNFQIEDCLVDANQKYLFQLNKNLISPTAFDLTSILNLMPYVKIEDLGKSWFFNFRVLSRIFKKLKIDSYFEIGSSLGYSLISICFLNETVKKIGWYDEEILITDSNNKLKTNLKFLQERYNRFFDISNTDNFDILPFFSKQYDVICINSRFIDKNKLLKTLPLILSLNQNKLFIFNEFDKKDIINIKNPKLFSNIIEITDCPNIFLVDLTQNKIYKNQISEHSLLV